MKAAYLRPLVLLPLLAASLALPLAARAAEHLLRADRTRSYIDVDVKSTVKNFTARLENYDARLTTDEAGKIKSAVLTFRFTDLKTGDTQRDADMIKWLGGGTPEGRFELGILAVAPDGQGQATGKLTFNGQTDRIEFAVNSVRGEDGYTITGETTIDYTQWGLKVIKKAFLFKVAPEVRVHFKLITMTPDTSSLVKP
jgi:polyisoprenoid-binding protein YceI